MSLSLAVGSAVVGYFLFMRDSDDEEQETEGAKKKKSDEETEYYQFEIEEILNESENEDTGEAVEKDGITEDEVEEIEDKYDPTRLDEKLKQELINKGGKLSKERLQEISNEQPKEIDKLTNMLR